jgi:DNA-binding NarL/FixJ family response regulator
MNKIKVLLVDDHAIVRNGVKQTLNNSSTIEVIGEASNGEEAISITKNLQPDVIVMDITMPVMNGIDATKLIVQQQPNCKVLILSMHDNETYVLKAIEAGASGFLLKDVEQEEFIKAIETVANGERYFNTKISNLLVSGYLNTLKTKPTNSENIFELTKRELDILRRIKEGQSNKEISEEIEISIRTIETHRANIMKKMNVKNAVDMIRVAIENEIV